MDTALALELGRQVTPEDMIAEHPGDPSSCVCRGFGMIAVVQGGQRVARFCERAVTAFRANCGARVQDTARGPYWKRGMSPEEWGFMQIFQAERRQWEWRRDFARRMVRYPA